MSSILVERLNQLSQDDFNSISLLVQQLTDGQQSPSYSLIEKTISNSILLIARVETEIVGMVTFSMYDTIGGRKGWIEDFVVGEKYRRMGIAQLLLDKVNEFAKDECVSSINLTSRPKRVAAHHFYEKNGFVKRDTDVFKKV